MSRVRLAACIEECFTSAGETYQFSHNVGTFLEAHVRCSYVSIRGRSAEAALAGMGRFATGAVLRGNALSGVAVMNGLTSPDLLFKIRPLTISLFRQMQLTRVRSGMFV